MRFAVLASFVSIVAIGILAGCTSRDGTVSQTQRLSGQSSQSPSPPADNARRITAADAYKLYEKGNVLIIDTRTEVAFKESHIKGAILVPVNEVAAKAKDLPHDKTIVTYCTWPAEHTSAGAVVTLKSKGFDNAAALLGGLAAWKGAGYPVEGTAEKQ